MSSKTAKPFAHALRELKNARGLTYRELAEKTRQLDGQGVASSYISLLANGHAKPSRRAVELIARACGVQPDYFLEYRPAAPQRRALNELGDRTTRPFGEALRGLKDARGLRYRELAEKTRQLDGKGLTAQYLNLLVTGHKQPSRRAVELIARACGVEPDYFLEYREAARHRRALNELGDRTTRPFGEALRGLKDAHGLTYRELAEKTRQPDGKGITAEQLGALARGDKKPSKRLMELIAQACGVRPDYFAEYRQATRQGAEGPNRPTHPISSTSTKPFGASLRELMHACGLTYRQLAEKTRQLDGKGMTHGHIVVQAQGHAKPSVRAMELIARACGVQPDYFAEYRLAIGTRKLDPSEVGLEQALENLDLLRGAPDSPGDAARSKRATRSSKQ